MLIGSLGCLKEAKTMDMIPAKCKFPNSFPYSNFNIDAISMCTYSICLFNKCVFTLDFYLNRFSTSEMGM